MTSYRERSADLARFYTVTEPQRHPRGYTVYKVTARIIVWKRYSDFKKLHKELWQIHKNLFRHSELFPPFAKGIVFGRFDETVIEERRQCAEDLLQFSANIPALYNSKQLEDFFKGGIINDSSELIGPAEAHSDSLIDTFPECSTEGESSPTRREAVKRRTAEYLMRAESISSLYGKPQLDDVSQVLLVMDTRTEQTFILKGLRKSSEYSRNRKTIIPRCVPNMVCLHKYIISEESVFLVLQHAEGGKLWSYISKFLNRSPEESFDIKEVKKPTLAKVHLQQPTSSPQDSSSFESRGSDGGSMLKALPLKSSLTPSSQDDSNQEDDGQDSSPKWPDSGSSSEEECTTSYLTLCNEYGQEKIEPGSLNEEPFMKTEGNGVDTKAIKSFPAHLAADSDSPSTQLRAHELKFFPNDDPEAVSSPRTSDSLSRSKNSPMEFFRIDSKDSASELLGLDFGEKLYSLKSEPLKPFFTLPDGDSASRSFNTSESKVEFKAQDTISRGSDDSVPVISFKDAAFDDVSGTDEGRPDLLVNLPGELESTREAAAMGPTKFTQTNIGIIENKLLEAPDVLCLRLSTEQCQAHEEKGIEELSDPSGPKSYSITEKHYAQEDPRMLFVAAVDHSSSGDMSLLPSSDPKFQGLGVVESAVTANNTEESLFRICSPLSGANEYIASTDTLKTEEVLLFTDQTDDLAKEEPTSLFQRDSETKGESGLVLEGDKEIHQIFEDLDKKLALTSRFYIPEGCIQRWAAEMVVALDALHREGIVCRDLNPNNILLNDRGHIQLTYFSRWSEVEDSCDSDAIERMYCAPEVGAITEETEACDWWSLGAVLFELLTGKTLVECHPAGINTHTTLNMPECVSEEARSLIQQLLQFNPLERLGAGVAGVEDIKSHPFFTPVDWAELMR
ncbi:ribosomal protein S6 kinase delta-1 isoform X13 [Gorilla gorilla gorilla]|uniref:ribosomal protein S6 kinase delta-1 isoform X11 n=1 Tax=Pan troglodytes TaxID=9598 RepID=UPI0023F15623|nr:ribosomal protein S6 kinase delta-1 isoform X10 [Pan troglodytes]XP_055227321.1 ribosomal protein S6 kinase delta-1 isoform X9 [Gorilla gorilla gorilla]